VALPVPGRITDLTIEATAPDDHRITFTVESGAVVSVLGRDVYDPPVPFSDAFELWAFLIVQNTPMELIERELTSVDPHWEDVVTQRRPRNDLDAAKAAGDEHRRRLRSEFKEGRGSAP
jgi:hypothetical protein